MKKITSVLSAIAASSFLGLPALAQTNSNYGATQCVPATSQSGTSSSDFVGSSNRSSSSYSARTEVTTNPTDTSTNSTNATVNSAVDAGTPGIRNFPNQTDPRAVPPASRGTSNSLTGASSEATNSSSSSSMSSDMSSGSTTTSANTINSQNPAQNSSGRVVDPSVAATNQGMSNDNSSMSSSGQMDQSTTQSSARRDPADSADPSIQGSPNQGLSSNGAPMGSSSSSQTMSADSPSLGTQQAPLQTGTNGGVGMSSGAGGVNSADSSTYTPAPPSGQLSQGGVGGPVDSQTRSYSSNTTTSGVRNPIYRNVLGRGGSTNGGGARIRIETANNPDWIPGGRGDTITSYFDQAQAGDNELDESVRNFGSQSTNTQSNNIQSNGVTSGGQASNQSSLNSYDAGSTGTTNQSSSSTMNSGTMANCPPGMVPIQSRSNQQFNQQMNNNPSAPNQPSADENAPGRAFPNTRQTPQTNP